MSESSRNLEQLCQWGPHPRFSPRLRQDDSAQISPLIVSTCVHSQLGPSFPQTCMTGPWRAAEARDPLSPKWNVDFQVLPPLLIHSVSTSPLLSSCPALHTRLVVYGLCESSAANTPLPLVTPVPPPLALPYSR